MSLGTPWMVLLLPVVALVGWLMARARRLQWDATCRLKGVAPDDGPAGLEGAADSHGSSPLPAQENGEPEARVQNLGRRDYLALAALACTVLALARPQWNPRPYDVERRGRDLVIALDVSRSMLAADVFPSRLEAARIAIHEAIPAWTGQRIGLITFAGSASVRVPLTLDHGFVRYMLDRSDPADVDLGSTSLQAAFEKAVGTVLTDATGGRRDLVVFTDGEDHLSDIEQTAEMVAKSGVRVLIIGLGDPVQGARVPDASGSDQWMQYQDADVRSRLQEGTLEKLAGQGEHVTYYPARTRPFDLVLLYQQMVSGAAGDVVVGQLRQVRYTEGYPYLLGLAVALWLAAASWLASSPLRLPSLRHLLLLVLLLPGLLLSGCNRQLDDGAEAAFQAKFKRGGELLEYAEEQSAADVSAGHSLLLEAREEFLRAALLKPGDIETARQIAAATHRLRDWEAAIEEHRSEEQERHERLSELIERLQKLTTRQTRLSERSSRLLQRRIASPYEDLSNSGANVNEYEQYDDNGSEINHKNDRRLARPVATEQQAVREGTDSVLQSVSFQQDTVRQILTRAYGDTGKPLPTELDPAVDLLAGAMAAQQQALASLTPKSVRWPQANTALHTAAGRMEQALESLRSQQPPSPEKEDGAMPSRTANDYNEDMAGAESEGDARKPQPVSAGDFTEALSLRSLPVPNYTAEEILAEESANQKKRARQKAARAGAKVEKNW